MIHVRALPGQAADHRAVRGPAHIPHHRRGPGDQDHEHARAHRMRAQVLLRDQVLAFPRRAVDHRDGVVGGPGPDPPREPARQAHQVSVVQHRIRLGVTAPDQPPPPGPEPARACCPSGSRRSARSGPRSHTSRSAAPRTAPRSHQPPADRVTSDPLPSAELPRRGHSFRAKSRTERRGTWSPLASIRAAMAGCWRSLSRQRARVGPCSRAGYPAWR